MTEQREQRVVACPTCKAPVVWDEQSRWRPFCSERCKLIDLGEWLDEEKRIPGEPLPATMEEHND